MEFGGGPDVAHQAAQGLLHAVQSPHQVTDLVAPVRVDGLRELAFANGLRHAPHFSERPEHRAHQMQGAEDHEDCQRGHHAGGHPDGAHALRTDGLCQVGTDLLLQRHEVLLRGEVALKGRGDPGVERQLSGRGIAAGAQLEDVLARVHVVLAQHGDLLQRGDFLRTCRQFIQALLQITDGLGGGLHVRLELGLQRHLIAVEHRHRARRIGGGQAGPLAGELELLLLLGLGKLGLCLKGGSAYGGGGRHRDEREGHGGRGEPES